MSSFSGLTLFDQTGPGISGNLNLNKNSLNPNIRPNHQHQLSINSVTSVNSIIEPITPPSNNHSNNVVITAGAEIDKEYLAAVSKIPLSQLKSDILRLSKDQYGCRFLQKKIDENLISNYSIRYANFEIIFNEIYLNLYELIIDPFGNYLIQKLIKYASNENLNLMLDILQSNLFQISINQHGTRALQKIIESLNSPYQLDLLTSGLKPFIIELIKDLNGNHVIQKILNKFKPLQCQFIYDSILNDLITVATHKHGCCVLQKCLNHVTYKQLNQFVNEILNDFNLNKLINDQFGNYVLQYLISINDYQIHYKFYSNLVRFDMIHYCNLKFSSNVIEKFIKNCANNEFKNNEVNIDFVNLKFEMVHHILKTSASLNKLINDPFGNYVIQTLIDNLTNPNIDYASLKPKNLSLLANPMSPNNEAIKHEIIGNYFQNCKIISSFGKRIQSKVSLILNNHNVPNSQFPPRTNQGGVNSSPIFNYDYTTNPNVPPQFMNVASAATAHLPLNDFSQPGSVHGSRSGSAPQVPHRSSSNSLESRSNSYPGVHSRSNSFQLNSSMAASGPMNSNYVLDKQLSHNLNNLKLSNNFYAGSVSQPQSVNSSSNVTPSMTGGQPGYFMNINGGPIPMSQSKTNHLNMNPNVNGVNSSNSGGLNYNSNGGGYLNNNTGMNFNLNNQGYLKTPQIFSNAPVNDFTHDSNKNINYFR
ncbi:protein necessary for high temperature growth [Yamadazyma tenuis]|nr:protein necessary for high temperature growth [Yamadazyma tenuis]